VVFLLLTVPVSLWVTVDREATLIGASRLLAGLALAYGLANWARSEAHIALLAMGLVVAGFLLVSLALVGMTWPAQISTELLPAWLHRAQPPLIGNRINANMMAGALVLLLPFPLALLLLAPGRSWPAVASIVPGPLGAALNRRWLRALGCGVVALSMLAVLGLTESYGGWIAAGVALILILIRRWRWLAGPILLLALILGLLAWQDGLFPFLEAIGYQDAAINWERRIAIWSRALYVIRDFPITGIGMNTFPQVVDTRYPLFSVGSAAVVSHTHNLFLQVAVDLGILGLVAFLAILSVALGSAWISARVYAHRGRGGLAALAWAGLVSLIGMGVHGMVDATTWVVGRGSLVPWAVLGALTAIQSRPQPSPVPEPAPPPSPLRWAKAHPLAAGVLLSIMLWMVLLGTVMGARLLNRTQPFGLPVPTTAWDVTRTLEEPAQDEGWDGPLKITTFSAPSPLADVVSFYAESLSTQAWEISMEERDSTEWNALFTHDEGHFVCLIDASQSESEVRVSIICGKRHDPVIPSTPLPYRDLARR
jgi:putative inorganic carbon (HCO3(-)) transporter